MNIKIKENTAVEKAYKFSELGFKICFLLFGLATFNSFTAHTKVISVLLFLTTAFAGITLIYW